MESPWDGIDVQEAVTAWQQAADISKEADRVLGAATEKLSYILGMERGFGGSYEMRAVTGVLQQIFEQQKEARLRKMVDETEGSS